MKKLLIVLASLCSLAACDGCSGVQVQHDLLPKAESALEAQIGLYRAACEPFPAEGTLADACRASYDGLVAQHQILEQLESGAVAADDAGVAQ